MRMLGLEKVSIAGFAAGTATTAVLGLCLWGVLSESQPAEPAGFSFDVDGCTATPADSSPFEEALARGETSVLMPKGTVLMVRCPKQGG